MDVTYGPIGDARGGMRSFDLRLRSLVSLVSDGFCLCIHTYI